VANKKLDFLTKIWLKSWELVGDALTIHTKYIYIYIAYSAGDKKKNRS
jgi:hypothetical protein